MSDAADDEDFFDRPLNEQRPSENAAAEKRLSPVSRTGYANNSSPDYGTRRSSSGVSNSDQPSTSTGLVDTETHEYDQQASSSSVKFAIVIPLPSDTQPGELADESKAPEDGGSREDKEPDQVQPTLYRKKKKKAAGKNKTANADVEYKGHDGRKSSSQCSTTSHSKSDYSSEEEKRHLQVCQSRRPISSACSYDTHTSQHLGTHKNPRATSAPSKRVQQSRPVSGFSNNSRMEMKKLLESLLQAERPGFSRRKSVPEPVEFRKKRNYTFSDQRLEMIERENKRLLGRIVMIHYTEPSYGRATQKEPAPAKPTTLPDVTRIKQLEKIQKENLVC